MPRKKKHVPLCEHELRDFVASESVTSTVSMTDAQLAALDDDGGPPVSIPDVGAQPEGYAVEGCPPSSGWRTRIAHTSLSPVPVMITTWEPYD